MAKKGNNAEREVWEAFSLFDHDGDNKISSSELALALRSLGATPSQYEIDKFVKELGNNLIDFKQFQEFLKKKLAERDNVDSLISQFEKLDKVFFIKKSFIFNIFEIFRLKVELFLFRN